MAAADGIQAVIPAGGLDARRRVIAAANEHWHCDGVFRDAAFPA